MAAQSLAYCRIQFSTPHISLQTNNRFLFCMQERQQKETSRDAAATLEGNVASSHMKRERFRP